MLRPAVKIENFEAVYDFYGEYEPWQVSAFIGHTLMSEIYKSDVAYEDGARQDIIDLAAEGAHFKVSSNHYTDRDQFTLGSFVMQDSQALSFFVAHTSIPAKEKIYKLPTPAKPLQPLVRRFVDIMGAVPASRVKDRFDGIAKEDRDPEMVALQAASSEALKATLVKLWLRGHLADFPEGERNRVYPREVQELKRGPVDATLAAREIDPSFFAVTLPIAMYYPETLKDGKLKVRHRRPSVHIGRPITEPIDDLKKLDDVLRPAIQDNLDAAVEMVRTKWGDAALLEPTDLRDIYDRRAEERRLKAERKRLARAA